MQFLKKELEFLNLYSLCANEKLYESDKFILQSIPDSTDIAIVQYGVDVSLVTLLPEKNINNKNFVIMYQVTKFNNILSLCNDDDVIEFSEEGIKFGQNSFYKFEGYELDGAAPIPLDMILKYINDTSILSDPIHIKDFDKVSIIKSLVGDEERDLNVIGFFNNYFVTSDQITGAGAILTDNNVDGDYYFPPIIYALFHIVKSNLDGLDIYRIKLSEDNEKYLFKINFTYIFVNVPEDSELPNIFSEKHKKAYLHPYTVEVAKNDILLALQKISIVTQIEFYNRIFLMFEKDKLRIENRDNIIGIEEIPAKVSQELEGTHIIISAYGALSMVNLIKADKIIFRVPANSENAFVISLSGGSDDVLFILNLYEETQ